MPSVRNLRRLALACVASCLLGPLAGADIPRGIVPLSDFPRERIAVETRGNFRRQLFEAWRADSPIAREQGLMFVEDASMRPDQAMIFVYDPPQYVAMWMKNTVLSLDMLFVDARGCVVTIRERAKPLSLSTISSGLPVALVVELRAGTVRQHGMAVGDRVVRLDAGWPAGDGRCTAAPPGP